MVGTSGVGAYEQYQSAPKVERVVMSLYREPEYPLKGGRNDRLVFEREFSSIEEAQNFQRRFFRNFSGEITGKVTHAMLAVVHKS